MMSLINSNEFFINVKNPPPYNPSKHFFEQSKDTLQFYLEEERKMREGLTIGGVFIHPWLYFHLNFFKTPIPQPDGQEKRMNPPLRDNEWYFAENLQEAQDKKAGLALFGSRRYSKSTIEASYIAWTNMTREGGVTEVVGGDDGDLKNLGRLLNETFTYMHPAFQLPRTKNDWEKVINFGVKDKAGVEYLYSQIIIKNADGGKDKSSEKGAGLSPIGFIIDEFGKFPFLSFFQGAIPSFETEFGWKLVPLLAGTGGNEELSADAYRLLSNPTAYNILPMNWDKLENKLEEKDLITWTRKSFGMYIPGQMSLMSGIKKLETNLGDYLKNDDEGLKNIKMKSTDWKTSKEAIEAKRLSLAQDKAAQNKQIMYYPLDPDDCFMSRIDNPFEVKIAKQHRDKLIEEGKTGRLVDIRVEGGKYKAELSGKTRAQFPFPGGIHDAPIVLYGDLPDMKPPYSLNVGGLDPYKQVKSTTDSVGVMYILQRATDPTVAPCERIMASYASRPNSIEIFNRNCEVLSEAFNAEVLMENADQSFIQYLESKNKAELILAEGVDLSKFINPNSKPSTNFGLYPTVKNQDFLLKLVIAYANKVHELGYDGDGNIITKYGVEYIDDIDLLQEIIDYKPGGNFDRIIAFGHALVWARRLDSVGIIPDTLSAKERQEHMRKNRPNVNRRGNKYGGFRRGKK
jgi:hypothetical protein